jgi:hypothetical protein
MAETQARSACSSDALCLGVGAPDHLRIRADTQGLSLLLNYPAIKGLRASSRPRRRPELRHARLLGGKQLGPDRGEAGEATPAGKAL